MKNIVSIIVLFILATSCVKQNNCILTAEVSEAWDGKPVILYTIDTGKANAVDSTIIKSGRFSFCTKFEQARYCQAKVYLDPENREDRSLTCSFNVFLDSTLVNAAYDFLQEKPSFVISGGQTQTLANSYESGLAAYTNKYSSLFKQYQNSWYTDENLQQGIVLAKQIDTIALQTIEYKLDFIKKNSSSAVSLHIIDELIDNSSRMTLNQLQNSYSLLSMSIRSSEAGRYTAKKLSLRHALIGSVCPDFEAADSNGEKHRLSELLSSSHYTLVEIWASWCAPCRGDLPFLKQIYSQYASKGFNIISVSIDSDSLAWKKAVNEEHMSWIQLLDSEKNSTYSFESSSVPTALLIDPKGDICLTNARGGWLLNKLQEIYDKKNKHD